MSGNLPADKMKRWLSSVWKSEIEMTPLQHWLNGDPPNARSPNPIWTHLRQISRTFPKLSLDWICIFFHICFFLRFELGLKEARNTSPNDEQDRILFKFDYVKYKNTQPGTDLFTTCFFRPDYIITRSVQTYIKPIIWHSVWNSSIALHQVYPKNVPSEPFSWQGRNNLLFLVFDNF